MTHFLKTSRAMHDLSPLMGKHPWILQIQSSWLVCRMGSQEIKALHGNICHLGKFSDQGWHLLVCKHTSVVQIHIA